MGPKRRTPCGISFQAAFASGIMLVALWGYLIQDRKLLQIIYGLHSCLLIAHIWIMDESPRWLWAQGRREEAVSIIARGVRWNGKGIPLDRQYYLSKAKYMSSENADGTVESTGISDLFKTPNLRMKTLNVSQKIKIINCYRESITLLLCFCRYAFAGLLIH